MTAAAIDSGAAAETLQRFIDVSQQAKAAAAASSSAS